MRKIIDCVKVQINKIDPKIIIATISLFLLTTIILCIISCNKHKKWFKIQQHLVFFLFYVISISV